MFSITTQKVELIYTIHKATSVSDEPFLIERIAKNKGTINITREVEEEVSEAHIITTDDDFRKRFKRSYHLIKLVTDTEVITIGAYTDSSKKMAADNLYVLCTTDFINLLARSEKIINADQLNNTHFEPLKCVFSSKELAMELLRN
jgi:hypothetical protein